MDITIAKLNNSKYMSWKRQIESLFVVEGLKMQALLSDEVENAIVRLQRMQALKLTLANMDPAMALIHMCGDNITFKGL